MVGAAAEAVAHVLARLRLHVRVLELQAVAHARIEEHADCGEGHDEALGDAVERQLHLKAAVVDGKIPEAVLQHDRHLGGILVLQALRQHDARGRGIERDVEMMVAGQPRLGSLREHGAHDAAHGVLGQRVIVDRRLGRHSV